MDATDSTGTRGGEAAACGAVVNDRRTGRLTTGRGLSDRQAAYAAFLAQGIGQRESARRAGYAVPEVEGWRLAQNPAVMAEVRRRREAALADAAGVALSTLTAIMRDEAAPAAARVRAATWTLEAAGHGLGAEALKLKQPAGAGGRDLASVSVAELEAIATAAQERLRAVAAQARDADTSQAIDV